MYSKPRFLNGTGRPSDPAQQLISQGSDSPAMRGAHSHAGSRRRRLLSTSKLRQKATLIFRAKAPHLRAHIKQSNACPHTHRSSCSKCSKPAASQQHVGIGTVIDSACSIGNRELKSSEGTAVASAGVLHQPPSSARTREPAGPKRPACLRLVPPHTETLAKGHFDISG